MTPRPMAPTDRRFVISTWAQSFAERAPWAKRVAKVEHWNVAERILDAGARCIVLGDDSGSVHAWACGVEPEETLSDILHYVYVPPELRGRGFARRAITALFDGYPKHIDVTHPWPHASSRFRWNPYELFRIGERRKAA